MKNEKIYITGLGSISAMGYGIEQTWSNLLKGKSGIKMRTEWKNNKIHSHLFGSIPNLSFKEEIEWKESFCPVMYSKLAIYACKKAIEDAKLDLKDTDNEIGMVITTSFGAAEAVEEYLFDLYQRGISKISPIKFTRTVSNSVLGDVSRCFKLNGPSSLLFNENSIGYGIDLIENGHADIIICGAVDHFIDSYVLSEQETGGLVDENKSLMQSLKESTNATQKILGDGSCFIVIESESSLKKRKGTAYAEIISYNASFDCNNVENTMKRSNEILLNNIKLANRDILANANLMFVSPYMTKVQIENNEPDEIINAFHTKVCYHISHKEFTGDMRSASILFGTLVACKSLKEQIITRISKQFEPTKIDWAFVNSTHEGGASSYLSLKSIKFNNK